MVVLGFRSIRVNVLGRTEHSTSTAWRTIQGREGRGGIVVIGGVQGILRIVFVGGIERVVGAVAIRWVHRITGIIAVRRVEGIVGRRSLSRSPTGNGQHGHWCGQAVDRAARPASLRDRLKTGQKGQ